MCLSLLLSLESEIRKDAELDLEKLATKEENVLWACAHFHVGRTNQISGTEQK